jgi:hypothetical protein
LSLESKYEAIMRFLRRGYRYFALHDTIVGIRPLPVLLTALRALGDAPARSLTALAQRLGVSEADAATVVVPREEEPTPVVAPDAPLLPMTGRNGASSAPRTLLNRPRVIAARKKTTP